MPDEPSTGIDRLLAVMARLRAPDGGCPWDLEQTYATIAPYTIEEAYEVAGAIADGDFGALRDELGDLLLQVVYHARMAEEDGHFTFADVAHGIAAKMIARHPHVFGPQAGTSLPPGAWEAGKAAERAARAREVGREAGALDGVSQALPALARALKLQRRAARVGFDWTDPEQVRAKVLEEFDEVRAATGADEREAEIGDLLFAVINLARHLGVDPEAALSGTNRRFERRFREVERMLRSDLAIGPEDATLEQMETRWTIAKETH